MPPCTAWNSYSLTGDCRFLPGRDTHQRDLLLCLYDETLFQVFLLRLFQDREKMVVAYLLFCAEKFGSIVLHYEKLTECVINTEILLGLIARQEPHA